MNESLQVDDLTFLVKRSARRKTIGLTVERDASLIAHLPPHVEISQARALIRTKLVWIHGKIAARGEEARPTVFRRPEFVDGEGFHFLGRHYRLKLVDSAIGPAVPTVRLAGDRLLFWRDQVPAGEKRIMEFYSRAAHPYLNEAVNRWKRSVAVDPARYVQVMDLGFRWGSCGVGGTLNFHWRIMQLAPELIDYVVVHELTHLKIADHSRAFWTEVHRVLPDGAALRDRLRRLGGTL